MIANFGKVFFYQTFTNVFLNFLSERLGYYIHAFPAS